MRGLSTFGQIETADGPLVVFRHGVATAAVREAFGEDILALGGTRGALVARLRNADAPLTPEPETFAGKAVLLAFRSGETAEAAAEWLDYHARHFGAEAALIVDRSEPGTTDFADQLARFGPALPVMVVTCDAPLGLATGPDMRDANTAPSAPKRNVAPMNPWHAPFVEQGLFECLRHLFLSKARAVAALNIADLLLPLATTASAFDAAAGATEHFVPLTGIEAYPWRLRKGEPAPFFDHVNRRFNENRRLLSWCVSPSAPGYWRAGRLAGVSAREGDPSPFLRAVGVLYPGTPVQKLVKKSLLQEEGELVRWMEQAFDAEPLRAPSAASILPRPASNRVTVVTAMKNEGPFVLDWIAHNRVIGISDHLVYTNDCQDGTDRLLDALAEANVHRRDNPYRESGKVPQYAAFRAAESERAVQDTDWLLTLDVDEYMNIHTGDGRIGDLLAALPDAHVISVPWRMFGNADAHRFEDRPVTEIFTLCAPEFATRPLQAWAFKTLYRNAGLFRRLGVHRPKGLNTAYRGALSWVDACGKPLPPAVWQRAWRMSKAQWGYDLVTLNHYAVRSAESFLVKRERGKVNRTRREQGLAYWFRMNHNAETDTSIHRYAEATRREKAALLALPGVAEAHAEAVAWHEARIKTLLAESDYAELYAQITSPRMERLSRMATCFGANVHLVGPQVIPDEIAARDPSEPFFWTVKLTPEM